MQSAQDFQEREISGSGVRGKRESVVHVDCAAGELQTDSCQTLPRNAAPDLTDAVVECIEQLDGALISQSYPLCQDVVTVQENTGR